MSGLLRVTWLSASSLLLLIPFALAGGHAAAQTSTTLAIDVDAAGNTPTSLAARDQCVSVAVGSTLQIDITIEDVVDLTAWEAYLTYDEQVVNIVDRDVQQFLAYEPDSNVIDTSKSVPDDDGRYGVGAAAISQPLVGVDGDGVLARLTLEAVGPGRTTLSISPSPTDIVGRPVAPTVTDVEGLQIGDSDGDSYFDGPILDADVAVGQGCDGSQILQVVGGGGGDGIPTWAFLAVVVGVVATVGFTGVALIAMRRSGSHRTS